VREEEPLTITIPTELERGDAFVVMSVGAGLVLVCWWLIQRIPTPAVLIPFVVIVLVWMVTNRSATEVRGVGLVAVLVRNKLGERDVHEWVLAAAHYWHLKEWPAWHRRLYWLGLWTISKHRGKCPQCVLPSN
jgi:hypothetical protein